MNWVNEAVKKWGQESQLRLLQEECAELIVAINKFSRRKKDSFINLAEEIADVEIMLSQIKRCLFDGLDKGLVLTAKRKKIKRLKDLLTVASKPGEVEA